MHRLAILITALLLHPASARDPNVIIIFTDDQGYNDLGCFGSETIRTPELDRLAAEGRRFTNFHVPSPVCSPSRAGLLTACYPKRVGMHRHVLFPTSDYGLNPAETTIADHLKARGYATACIGKWHLGHQPEVLPRAQGFDSYYGIPYSNDMNHPGNENKPRRSSDEMWLDQENSVKLWNTPLVRNEEIIELPVDQRSITRRYTDEAIQFITQNQERPFFLYLAHSMPHIPLFVPEDAYDADPGNAYKAVIEHIDSETGRLVNHLREAGLADENTIVVFTSDNGPWLQFKNHGGSAKPLREGKGTTFEGGQRVPFIIWSPGRVPAGGSSDALASTIDLFPSLAAMAGHPYEPKMRIDGLDLSNTLTGDTPSARNEFLHYNSQGHLEGIRQGDWKLLVKQAANKPDSQPHVMLFNLADDIGERSNLAAQELGKVELLRNRMQELDAEIEANSRPVWTAVAK